MKSTPPLNKVHVGASPHWIKNNINDNTISLTMTSPPVYDDGLYIESNGEPEFGWSNYAEYLDHFASVAKELFRVALPGGYLVIDTSSAPREFGSVILDLFPIPADFTKICLSHGWIFHAEIIWEKSDFLYQSRHHPTSPNSVIRQVHDQLLVFRKKGERDECGSKYEYSSVWKFPRDASRESLNSYKKVYSTFPDALIQRVLEIWTCEGDIIFDPYAGSGQVVRVAKEMGRYGIGVEYHEKWRGLWEDL